MNIVKGKKQRAQRVVIYGPEGVGKTTFAAQFPNPLFIDVEGGTTHLDVARVEGINSWTALKHVLGEFKRNSQGFQTLVIDTADWAERLCIEDICASHQLSSLGGQNDYGRSYNLLETQWAKFLDFLTEICNQGIHVVLLAHAQMRKFEQPEEAGAYDRWELKLQKKPNALLSEWPDALFFASYATIVVEVDGKKKAQGGQRVLRTSHHPCWDAKNRYGLPDELPLEFASVAHCFPAIGGATALAPAPAPEPAPQTQPQQPAPVESGIPSELAWLMNEGGVEEHEIRKAVAARGYYPEATPISNYDPDFISGVLVARWDKLIDLIQTQIRGAA